MRSHNPNDAANTSIQTSSNYPEDYILAREYTSDLEVYAVGAGRIFHDANGCHSALFHQLCNFANGCFRGDCSWLRARVHDCGQVGQRSLFTEGIDVCEHSGCLRIRRHAGAELRLHAGKSIVELLRCGGAAFDLVEGLVEYSGNIEQTDDVSFLVANGLPEDKNEMNEMNGSED